MAELEGVAEAIVVNPGDTLVVRVDRATNLAQLDQLRIQAEEALPGVKVVIVAADQMAVTRG